MRNRTQHATSGPAAFFAFRRMVTPLLVQTLFVVGLALCMWQGGAGIVELVGKGDTPVDPWSGRDTNAWSVLEVGEIVGWLVVLPLLLRLLCETLIVLFRINETLTDVLDHTSRSRDVLIEIRKNTQ